MNESNQGEDIADYVNQNHEGMQLPKTNKFKQKIEGLYEGARNLTSSLYRGFFKASTVAGATTVFCANYSTINNFVEKYTGNEDAILNFGLNDAAMGGLAVSTVLASYLMAKKYNPLEKIVSGTGKLVYSSSKFGAKSVYNSGKFFVEGTRDFVGEIIVAPVSQKLRSKITTKETYESNMEREEQILEHRRNKALKKADNLQSKINKLQKLKINYQDNMVENPGLYSEKIEDANEKLKSLYEQKNSLNPDAI